MKGILASLVIAQTQDDPMCITAVELAELDMELKLASQANAAQEFDIAA